jgi:hypothetical protein
LVFPDPADAATNADTPGCEATSCAALARSLGEVKGRSSLFENKEAKKLHSFW